VRIDYFSSRLLVDYLSTSRLIVDYFSQLRNYFWTVYVSRKPLSTYGLKLLCFTAIWCAI